MKEFIEIAGAISAVALGLIFGLFAILVTVFILALPFIAIGVGMGFVGWTLCLFVSFC